MPCHAMQILQQSKINIEEIIGALKSGQTIVYPTETCYGLGCDATNAGAVDKLFTIKQRQKDKPMLVLMADIAMAMEYVSWNTTLKRLAQQYWPGPLTVVAPLLDEVDIAPSLIGSHRMLAFRVTSHPFAQELVRGLGKPLVSTSANIAAEASPYDIAAVLAMFEHTAHQPDIIIDAGPLPHRAPSTIVRVSGDRIEIIRQGDVVV